MKNQKDLKIQEIKENQRGPTKSNNGINKNKKLKGNKEDLRIPKRQNTTQQIKDQRITSKKLKETIKI